MLMKVKMATHWPGDSFLTVLTKKDVSAILASPSFDRVQQEDREQSGDPSLKLTTQYARQGRKQSPQTLPAMQQQQADAATLPTHDDINRRVRTMEAFFLST